MTIPIRNLYYLFLYAWARFPGGSTTEIGFDNSPDLPNLFARLLVVGTRSLFRRGLDRGYNVYTCELQGLRGRLRMDRMIKGATQLRGATVCDVDELSHDVLHNQILKATLVSLAACRGVEACNRHDLHALARLFHDVEQISLSASHFRRTSVSRNSREYGFLIRLCEFVFWSLMPDERGAKTRFQTVDEDEMRMSAVFEEFLRNFFKMHRSEYRVRAESPAWNVSEATPSDLAFLPRMITDITLRQLDHTIIVDAKFYKSALLQSPYGERVRSQHLYQLITYLQHERARQVGMGLSGMLIYPDVGQSLRLRYRLLGIPVLIATVDLSKEWPIIAAELHELLNDCATAARKSSETEKPQAGSPPQR
ncbi:5-methylcytosine-specific restriction enzyme subunit McrC [Bradyrhizobium sp. LB1.3]